MFSRHYHSELSFLREMVRVFAKAHPKTAGMLGERGGDPDIERLLQAFSFLAARIRERLDDEVPEVIHELCGLVAPQYLRSIPACSVVEFSPLAAGERQSLSAGTELVAVPVENTSCRFRTTQPVDAHSLSVQEAILEGPQSSKPLLRLSFLSTKAGIKDVFTEAGIRLFLHGEFAVATTLWLWFVRYCRDVTLRGHGGKGPELSLGHQVIRPVGFEPEDALLPWPRQAPASLRLLQEYFTLPQKFLFIDLKPLSQAREVAEERFELAFAFDRPLKLPGRIGADCFRLYCAPVINLFQASADLVRSDLQGAEHLLRPAGVNARHAEVYSVDAVTELSRGSSERIVYSPFVGYEHLARPQARQPFYRLRRERSPSDDGLDTYLALGAPREFAPSLGEGTLSVDLTCTNRALAGRLRTGEISVSTKATPHRFTNLLPATKPVVPPMGDELHWRLLGNLAAGQHSFQDVESLRALLSLHDFQGAADSQAGSSRRLAEAIQSVEARSVRRLVDEAALCGAHVTVEIHEASFASRGELVLFGFILDELLASRVSLNSFTVLHMLLRPSGTEYLWSPRTGSHFML